MALTREDHVIRIGGAIQDAAQFLEPDDKWRFLDQAVLLFSKQRPQIKVCEITGDGSTYEWSVGSGNTILDDWIEDFSHIKGQVEYPAGDSQIPQFVDPNYHKFYRKLVSSVTTLYFRIMGFIPATGKIVRFEYVIPHTLSDASNTIKDGDSDAVINLAAALCFWALAAKFAQSSEPTLDADTVDYQSKADKYIELAKERVAMYNSFMGIGGESKATASAGVVFKDLDINYPGTLGDYLTHPSALR